MRPAVEVSAPQALFVGEHVGIDVNVTPYKPTKVDFIDAILTGDQGWTVGSGKSQVTYREKNPYLRARLHEEGELPADQTLKLRANFTLPPGTAPTHDIRPAWARLKLRIHVSIPWGLDGRHDFDLRVRVPPPRDQTRTPFAASTTISAPDKPRIEIGLASRRVAVGEVLDGTCAVFHMDDSKQREVSIDLVPSLALYGRGGERDRRGEEISGTIIIPAGFAGRSVPFRIALPPLMTPNFRCSSHQLQWFVIAHTGSFFGAKAEVAVPLEVLDSAAQATLAKVSAAPRLGDERIAALFDTYGRAYGWQRDHVATDGTRAEEIKMTRERGEQEHSLEYAYRGTAGAFLVSRIAHPSLGLGLLVKPATARDVFFHDVEVDIAAWDRAHHVDARAPHQAIPFLRAVAETQESSLALGALVRWTDHELVYEKAVAVLDDAAVAQADGHLSNIARTIEQAAEAIAAPASVLTDVPAWQELARSLDGVFSAGDLSLYGKHRGQPVEVGLEWTPEWLPAGMHIAVGDPEHASGHVREVGVTLRSPALEADAAPPELRELLAKWPVEVRDFVLRDGVASVSLAVEGAPSRVEVGRVREVIEGLGRVLEALDPARGPYR